MYISVANHVYIRLTEIWRGDVKKEKKARERKTKCAWILPHLIEIKLIVVIYLLRASAHNYGQTTPQVEKSILLIFCP